MRSEKCKEKKCATEEFQVPSKLADSARRAVGLKIFSYNTLFPRLPRSSIADYSGTDETQARTSQSRSITLVLLQSHFATYMMV